MILGLWMSAGQASFRSSSPTTYIVRSGDNLWTLGMAHHLTVDQLAAANGLDPEAILRIGTHLSFPERGASVSTATSTTISAGSGRGRFCSTFVASPGAEGVLPAGLRADPSRQALRPIFERMADRYGVSPALVEAVAWQESGWQQGVVSSASAVGIGQLLPSTAAFVSGLIGTPLNINNPTDNIEMEARYLAYLQSHLDDTCSTIAGYYEGLQNMRTRGVLSESEAYVASVEALVANFS